MSQFTYEAIKRSPSHSWSVEQKVTLCILIDVYEVSWLGVKTIFNALFSHELYSPRGLTKGALFSMHRQLTKAGFKHTGGWVSLRKSIEDQAVELGVNLPLKATSDAKMNSGSARSQKNALTDRSWLSSSTPRTRTTMIDDNSSSDSDDTLIGDDDGRFETPTKSRGSRPAQRSLQIPSLSKSSLIKKPAQRGDAAGNAMPRLVFRAYSNNSQGDNSPTQFRAGAFAGDSDVPESPDPHSLFYRKEAARHIRSEHSGPAPFVSTTQSLIRAYTHACKMGTNSTIAVIDLHEANKGSQYARCKSVQQLQLQEFTREGYTGGGEWLIYGGTDAIVGSASSLEMERIQGKDTLSFGKIRQANSSYYARIRISSGANRLSCCFRTGQAVSRLAQAFSLPRELLPDFVSSVVEDWAFKQFKTWKNNQDFLAGIESGFKENMLRNPPPETEPFNTFIESFQQFINNPQVEESTTVHRRVATLEAEGLKQLELFAIQHGPRTAEPSNREMDIKTEPRSENVGVMDSISPVRDSIEEQSKHERTQGHQWKKAEGRGSFMLFYEPCGL